MALLALTLSANAPLQAGVGMERFRQFFSEVTTVRADFTQVLTSSEAETLQEAGGTVLLQRPGKFRWDYVTPFHQLIVGDGAKVWIYDADLEQVTVKSQDLTLGNTPALLLSTMAAPEDKFLITELGERTGGGLEWVELQPKDKESSFDRVRLAFGPRDLEIMELVDALGQTTRLSFSNVSRNTPIDAAQFVFVPPKGVDVIGE